MNLKIRLTRLEAKRSNKTEYPHWTLELSDGRALDFFHDPEVADILGWGHGPPTFDGEIVGLKLQPQ